MKFLYSLCLFLLIPLFAESQAIIGIQNGGTGAPTNTGAWKNIFSGANIAANCSVISTGSNGTLTCSPSSYLTLAGGTLTGPLSGTSTSFSGALTSGSIEGAFQADQQQTPAGTGNNGIVNSIVDCLSQAFTCYIEAPALYSLSEAQPYGGFAVPYGIVANSLGPLATSPVSAIEDMRYGVPQWFFNSSIPWGGVSTSARNQMSPAFSTSAITVPGGTGAHFGQALTLTSYAYAGYRNSYLDKASPDLMQNYHYKWMQGQLASIGDSTLCMGNGDCLAESMNAISFGGPNATGDEGTESMRSETGEGGAVYYAQVATITPTTFTIGSNTYTSAQTITTSAQVNPGYQGEGRILIDTAKKYNGAAHNNYVASISQGTGSVACGGSCDWDSTFGTSTSTTLSIAITNTEPSTGVTGVTGVNQFPYTNSVLTIGSTTNFTVGNLACVYDYDYECETISAVGTGTITLATLRLPHIAGATIVTGGLTGFGWEFEADQVASGNTVVSGLPDSNIPSNSVVRQVVPILNNSSGNALTLFQGGVANNVAYGPTTSALSSVGAGITIAITVSSGVVTACTPSGGSGYASGAPPAIVFASTGSPSIAPSAHLATLSGGTFTTCVIDQAGVGVSGSATASAPTVNPYDIYPAAKVWQVYNAAATSAHPNNGSVDGTLYTEPFTGATGYSLAVGDNIEQPHHYWQHVQAHRLGFGSIIPSIGKANSSGLSIAIYGKLTGQDAPLSISNSAGCALYMNCPIAPPGTAWNKNYGDPWTPGHGQLPAPDGISLVGSYSYGLNMYQPPLNAPGPYGQVIGAQCGAIGCANWNLPYKVVSLSGNGNGYQSTFTPSTNAYTEAGVTDSENWSTSKTINVGGCVTTFSTTGTAQTGACTNSNFTLSQNPLQNIQGASHGSSYGYAQFNPYYSTPGWNFYAYASSTTWFGGGVYIDGNGAFNVLQCPSDSTTLSITGCHQTLIVENNVTNSDNGYALKLSIPTLAANLPLGISVGGANLVTGPATSTAGHIATFSNTSGALQDSSIAIPSIRAGSWSISSSTSVSITFSTAMSVAPTSCAIPISSSSATTGSPFYSNLATTGFTVNVPTSGTLAGTYQCVVNNAN